MQVSEFPDHPYWSILSLYKSAPSKQNPTGALKGKPHPEYAHVRALDGSISPRDQQMKARVTANQFKPQQPRSTMKSNGRYRKKRFGLSDPVLWDVIHRTLAQQQRLSSLVESALRIEESGRPSIPSRTSSQRRALNHFTRQLEKYADAAGARGRQPIITPTESDAKTSLHTVKPLLPYMDEFEAAGLAVTSEQQRFHRRSRRGEFDGQDGSPSPLSNSSSGSILEFTPPNRNSNALPVSEKEPKHEGKSRLPWLRRRPPAEEKIIIFPPDIQPKGEVKEEGRTRSRLRKPGPRPKASAAMKVERYVASLPTDRHDKVASKEQSPAVSPAKPPRNASPSRTQDAAKRISKNIAKGVHVREEPHEPHFRYIREMARPVLPRPGTIDEEEEPVPHHHEHFPLLCRSQRKQKSNHKSVAVSRARPELRTKPDSSAPKLPYTWKYAVSNASSLERALKAVSKRVEEEEDEGDVSNRRHRAEQPKAMLETTNRSKHVQKPTNQHAVGHSHHPLLAKESCSKNGRPVPPRSSPKPSPTEKASPTKPTRQSVAEPKRQPQVMPQEPTVQPSTVPNKSPSELQAVLNDLDVFFDYDDRTVSDRDVLKGLQVAVSAAADDGYDTKIRNRTGLCIRRFLADLMSIDILDAELTANQPARQRREEQRRLQRVKARRERKSPKV